MSEHHDIKKIWQEASRRIEKKNHLSQAMIIESIESKSKDVISQFVKEKKTALFAGMIIIPLIIVELMISFSVNLYTVLIAVFLLLATSLAFREGLKHLKKMKQLNESGSLQESLSGKLKYLSRNFRRGQYLSPIIGIGIFLPMTLMYRYLEYGDLKLPFEDIVTLGIALVGIIGLTLLLIQFQKYKYLQPLKECLNELQQMEPPATNKRLRINIGLVLAILLVITLLLYVVAKYA